MGNEAAIVIPAPANAPPSSGDNSCTATVQLSQLMSQFCLQKLVKAYYFTEISSSVQLLSFILSNCRAYGTSHLSQCTNK
jgi:hypothetical protein